MQHFLYYPGLDFVFKESKRKIDSDLEDGESGGEIIQGMGKNESAGIHETQSKWSEAGVNSGDGKSKRAVPFLVVD
jgi:hypothetical protein